MSFVLIGIIFSCLGESLCAVCNDGQTVGDDLADFSGSVGTANQGFMLSDISTGSLQSAGEIGCYGAVQRFQIRCFNEPSLRVGSIELDVWRPTGGNNYDLVGKQIVTFTCPPGIYSTQSSAKMHPWNQIPVQPGDRIGFMLKDPVRLLATEPGVSCCDLFERSFPASPAAGSTVSWAGTSNKRRVAIQAIVGPSIPPQWDNLPYTVRIRESSTIGNFVFDARASDKNSVKWAPNGDEVFYSLTSTDFAIDSTGKVTTTNALDYDTAPVYYLEILARDGSDTDGQSATGTLTVSIIPDNTKHSIINLPSTITVDAEVAITGATIFNVSTDKPNSDTMKYRIVSQNPNFQAFEIGNDGRVIAALNLEDLTERRFELEIVAFDNAYSDGPEVLTIFLKNIRVPPVFVNLPETVSVPEDVIAKDDDGDKLTYSFADISPSHGVGRFLIDPKTGRVSISENPGFDREEISSRYLLNIMVDDGLYNNVTDILIVEISDVPENPVFDPKVYYATIDEDQLAGTQVKDILFSAYDPDGDDEDTLSYSILTGTGTEYFMVFRNFLLLRGFPPGTKGLDAGLEVPSVSYEFSVLVTDNDGLTDTANVNITVINTNDPMAFDNLNGTVTLDARTTLKGKEIFQVQMKSHTIEFFDFVTCEMDDLPSPNDGLLAMDPVTGIVTVTKDLRDHPTSTYVLPITCNDRRGFPINIDGTPGYLTVEIANVKQPPVLDNLPSTITLPENLAEEVDVFKIQASDKDQDPIVKYNLLNITPKTNKFTFDTKTGLLKTIPDPQFDFETVHEYQVLLSANNYLYESTQEILTIIIQDINEKPVFTTVEYNVIIDEALPNGTIIDLLPNNFDAVDPEGDSVTYVINPGPFFNYFIISGDGAGNQLEINKTIDVDNGGPDAMTLEVIGADPQGLTSKVIVTIHITEVNDNSPVFDPTLYTSTIKENTPGGSSITTVTATDRDLSLNGKVTYSIVGNYVSDNTNIGDLLFQVDSQSGLVTVKHQADFEQHSFVAFQVLAEDVDGKSATAVVEVTIEDVNDYRPTFVKDFFNLEVPSYIKVGSHIVTLRATDNDSGLRGDITYYFLPADNNDYFLLNEDNGRIFTDQTLITDHRYVLYAFAEDKGLKAKDIKQTSTAAIVRIDSYDPKKCLISIYMTLTLDEFKALGRDHFIEDLSNVLSPWIVKIESVEELESATSTSRRRKKRHPHPEVTEATEEVSSEPARIRVNIYALRDSITDSVANVEVPKSFVHRNDLLPILRKNIFGTPTKVLQLGDMKKYDIVKVEPKHPIWIIDTLEGILTLASCCLLFLMVCIGTGICCCWKYKVCCFAKRKRDFKKFKPQPTKSTPKPNNRASTSTPLPAVEDYDLGDGSLFKLNYRPGGHRRPELDADARLTKYSNLDKGRSSPDDPDRWAGPRPLSTSSIHTSIVPNQRGFGNPSNRYS